MLAACKRILENRDSTFPAKVATFAKLSDMSDSTPSIQPTAPISASLSDAIPEQVSEPPPTTVEEIATVDNAATPIRMSLKSDDSVEVESIPFENNFSSNATANVGQLKQKLLRANRFVPVTGAVSVPIQSSSLTSDGSRGDCLGQQRIGCHYSEANSGNASHWLERRDYRDGAPKNRIPSDVAWKCNSASCVGSLSRTSIALKPKRSRTGGRTRPRDARRNEFSCDGTIDSRTPIRTRSHGLLGWEVKPIGTFASKPSVCSEVSTMRTLD